MAGSGGRSRSGRHSSSRGSKKPAGSGHRRSRSSSGGSSSSLVVPVASAATIRVSKGPTEKPVYRSYLAALVGILMLVLLGGGDHPIALAFALVLPGACLLIAPPFANPGKWVNIGTLGVLGVGCLAFIPLFYWPDPKWIEVAREEFGLSLPHLLSIQPAISFEALLLAIAGFAWFYVALSFPLNTEGRRRVFFWISVFAGVFASAVIVGNLFGWRYPGTEGAQIFTFFPNRNQTANLLAVSGVLSFGFAMEGLKKRELPHLVGLLSSVLVVAALMMCLSRAGIVLFFVGLLIWFMIRVCYTSSISYLKLALPVAVAVYCFAVLGGGSAIHRIKDLVSSADAWQGEYRLLVYQDTIGMVEDYALTGAGFGNFSAVFPQYREVSSQDHVAQHPESDLLWLMADGGLLGVAFFAAFLFGVFRWLIPLPNGRGGSYQLIALSALIVFILHGVIDVSGHRPGTVYFAVLVAALAMPPALQSKSTPVLSPRIWRWLGAVLVFFGLLWAAGAGLGLPVFSKVALATHEKRVEQLIEEQDYEAAASELNKALDWSPLQWRYYFRRAQVLLAWRGDKQEASIDFRRAGFVEPTLSTIPYQEGLAWIPYDLGKAISAWREALFRKTGDPQVTFRAMLSEARDKPGLMSRLKQLSLIDPGIRTILMTSIGREEFLKELEIELTREPSLKQFDKSQRTELIETWIMSGDLDSVQNYLETYGSTLDREWYLWSKLRYQQARFEEAVELIREAVPVPEIPGVGSDDKNLQRVERSFAADPTNPVKGTALFQIHFERGEDEEALKVLELLSKMRVAPAFTHYWRGELLFRKQDYIDSWNAFDTYLKHRK